MRWRKARCNSELTYHVAAVSRSLNCPARMKVRAVGHHSWAVQPLVSYLWSYLWHWTLRLTNDDPKGDDTGDITRRQLSHGDEVTRSEAPQNLERQVARQTDRLGGVELLRLLFPLRPPSVTAACDSVLIGCSVRQSSAETISLI